MSGGIDPEILIISSRKSQDRELRKFTAHALSMSGVEAEGRRSGQGRWERDRGVGPYRASVALCSADMVANESIDALELEPASFLCNQARWCYTRYTSDIIWCLIYRVSQVMCYCVTVSSEHSDTQKSEANRKAEASQCAAKCHP